MEVWFKKIEKERREVTAVLLPDFIHEVAGACAIVVLPSVMHRTSHVACLLSHCLGHHSLVFIHHFWRDYNAIDRRVAKMIVDAHRIKFYAYDRV